jgi:transcriptional regulator with XRE-family HTH domain
MEEKIKELGLYIDELRQQRNLGFNQLAKKSGVNVKTLNEIMYGKARRINPTYLIQLAKALRVHYKEFYWIIGYLLPEDDIVKNKKEKNFNFINSKIGDNNVMIGGNITNSNINTIIKEDEEDILDLTKLDKADAESIKNIYNSLLKK